MKAFIVYATYTAIENETHIQLFGKLENGHSFLALTPFKPYFYIEKADQKKLKNLKKEFTISQTKLTNFQGKPVIKISAPNASSLNNLNKAIHKTIDTYEADVRPHYRFLYDNNILGSINIEGAFESNEKIDRVYQSPEITSSPGFQPKLKVASIDTESGQDGLYCIGITSDNNYKKNFLVTKTNQKLKNTINCITEEECLEKFKQEINKLDPDVITGWNVIDFDFPFLKELYKKHKIPFDISRTNNEPRIRIESNFFRSSSADIEGRQVLDGLNLIRDPLVRSSPTIRNAKIESYTLEDASQAIINKGKLLKGKDRHKQIEALYKSHTESSLQKLVDYNIMDCQLVYDILDKTKMIDLAIERSQLTGLPLDRISGSIASFDSLYIREANKKGLVSPSATFTQKEERITGGYVQEAVPGIYHNILVLDFKSLYPSIIKTFNIDPASYLEKKAPNAIESPNKAYFKNQQGILPDIITKLHAAREKAKKENRPLSNYAIKIIMNSFFGVLANPNCRYFNLKIANAITHFGQHIIKLTAKEIEKKFRIPVIYSDTDSNFVNTKVVKKEALALGKEIEVYINNFYKNYTEKNYNRESFLELEYEKLYLALMLPKIRGSTSGAKKRYAGLIEKPGGSESLEITGLEAIRGDWTEAAQDFQRSLLMKIFHKENPSVYIKSYVKKVQQGKLDEKLVYKKSIRKPLEEYTKTTPPHVKAARKLKTLDSNLVKYYITIDGPEPIQKLKHKLDYEHYIEKQIKPIANQVLTLFDKDFDSLIADSKQTKLF
jgi:DNA polymerase II